MGEAIGTILAGREDTPQAIPCSGSIYMDDTYYRAESLDFLQKRVEKVETALAREGLHIIGEKTECVCSHACEGAGIRVGGQQVPLQGPGHVIKVLVANFSMGCSVSTIIAAMQQKAAGVLAANKAIFRGHGTLANKADILIRPAALRGCGTWPCHAALLQAANTMQLRILRDSGNYGRHQGEIWAEWNQRTLRQCRLSLHRTKQGRWSTFILGQIWQLHGHVARGCEMGRTFNSGVERFALVAGGAKAT